MHSCFWFYTCFHCHKYPYFSTLRYFFPWWDEASLYNIRFDTVFSFPMPHWDTLSRTTCNPSILLLNGNTPFLFQDLQPLNLRGRYFRSTILPCPDSLYIFLNSQLAAYSTSFFIQFFHKVWWIRKFHRFQDLFSFQWNNYNSYHPVQDNRNGSANPPNGFPCALSNGG